MKIFIIKIRFFFLFFLTTSSITYSQKLLIPMDLSQTDHLKAYGITYWFLSNGGNADWLLNYRGGSFLFDYSDNLATECRIRGVSFESITSSSGASILEEVKKDGVNMDAIRLEKAPKIAVYVPPGVQPWDDAVRMALEYAEIKYDIVWDEEVMNDKLKEYDWLHLHHEDFTGQHGKFWVSYRNAPWYIQQVALCESMAKKLGFADVCQLKKAVAEKIKSYVASGGFIFAMCTATDSFDVALAATNIDICDVMFDGTTADPSANDKLDFSKTLAFENFKLIMDPTEVEFSTIDVGAQNINNPDADYFTLFDFSAKYDPVPTMLTQNHVNVIHGFLGQTTAFDKQYIKNSVTILAIKDGTSEVKYLHGNVGRGTFTWYGGHDPEDYVHRIGDPPTDLSLFKNSPGYRLILNNVLFPAAKKKKQKT